VVKTLHIFVANLQQSTDDAFAKTPGCHPDQQGGIFQLPVKAGFLPAEALA